MTKQEEIRKFKLSGEAVFYAKGIDDAFGKLSKHFKALSKGDDSSLFDAPTEIRLQVEEGQ